MYSDLYAFKYVPWGHRTLNAEEIAVRRIAQELKLPTLRAVRIAAMKLAPLIDSPCWLVPVPTSTGSLDTNLALAQAIAQLVLGARVKRAVGRLCAVESSRKRRAHGLFGLSLREHKIVRIVGPIQPLPVYFVDNVIKTGTTVAACRRALGWGRGLVFADASAFHPLCALPELAA